MAEVAGIGVDLVHAERIRSLVSAGDEATLDRWFTPGERAYAGTKVDPASHLAARFAAKEAFVKALGCGVCPQVSWLEIEVVPAPAGKPTLALAGSTAEFFAAQGGGALELSLSHDGDYALAIVLILR